MIVHPIASGRRWRSHYRNRAAPEFMGGEMETTRRQLLESALAALATTAVAKPAFAQAFSFTPNQRYPDPSVEILDPSFTKYRIYSSTLEQLATGMRWAEGPVYFPDERYVLVSDIPNNRIMKYDEAKNTFTVFR